LKELNDNDQVVWRYVSESGEITEEDNPNGSIESIAGICNLEGNVVGLMPHPERASESELSPWKTEHGKLYFESIENFHRRS
jgi:phosphoribosylformylglycinamidine synthase